MPPITFGFTMAPVLPVDQLVSLARFLEALGYDRLWFPDHMLFPEGSPAPDVWSIMAAIAVKTRRIEMGPAVTDPHRVHPAVLAQRIATLDQLSKGRLLVGLGSGEAMNLEPYGIPWDRRVGRLKEAMLVLRGLLDSREPLTFHGDFFHLDRARIDVTPYQRRRIPLLLAALGPMMQRIAGQLADGWFPVVLPPEHYGEYFEPMAEAARLAQRDPASFDKVALVPVALLDRGSTAPDKVARIARSYALTLFWPPVARRMGWEVIPPAHLEGADYVGVNPCDPESLARFQALQAWVPDDLLARLVHCGDAAALRKVIARYIEAGATSIDLCNLSPDPVTSTVTLATEVLPYFTRRSATVTARLAGSVLPLASRLGLVPRVDAEALLDKASPHQRSTG